MSKGTGTAALPPAAPAPCLRCSALALADAPLEAAPGTTAWAWSLAVGPEAATESEPAAPRNKHPIQGQPPLGGRAHTDPQAGLLLQISQVLGWKQTVVNPDTELTSPGLLLTIL